MAGHHWKQLPAFSKEAPRLPVNKENGDFSLQNVEIDQAMAQNSAPEQFRSLQNAE
jgi:hypothetical protein